MQCVKMGWKTPKVSYKNALVWKDVIYQEYFFTNSSSDATYKNFHLLLQIDFYFKPIYIKLPRPFEI